MAYFPVRENRHRVDRLSAGGLVFRLLCTFDASELVFYVDDMPVTSSGRRGGRII
jgi:hypothetical protein